MLREDLVKNWVDNYVDDLETPNEVIRGIIINALVCAYKHHETCVMGEGKEAGKVYRDMFDLVCGSLVDINILEVGNNG